MLPRNLSEVTVMTIDDKIRNKKLQNDITGEVAKISALLSVKIDQYECLAGEKCYPINLSRILGQAKFTYCSLGTAFQKQ